MIFVAFKSELFGSRSISWDEISKNPGNQPMYSNRISSLFTNNPLFNIKPRNQTDALEEEDECSQAGIHELKTVRPELSVTIWFWRTELRNSPSRDQTRIKKNKNFRSKDPDRTKKFWKSFWIDRFGPCIPAHKIATQLIHRFIIWMKKSLLWRPIWVILLVP